MLDAKLSARQKWVVMVIGLVAFALALQTHVRTAILGAAAGIFCGAAYSVYKKKRHGLALALVLGVVGHEPGLPLPGTAPPDAPRSGR